MPPSRVDCCCEHTDVVNDAGVEHTQKHTMGCGASKDTSASEPKKPIVAVPVKEKVVLAESKQPVDQQPEVKQPAADISAGGTGDSGEPGEAKQTVVDESAKAKGTGRAGAIQDAVETLDLSSEHFPEEGPLGNIPMVRTITEPRPIVVT